MAHNKLHLEIVRGTFLDGQVPTYDASSNSWVAATGGGGTPGADGKSAYEVAVENGFSGDETAWLASLVGATGPAGSTGATGATGAKGDKGDPAVGNLDGGAGSSVAVLPALDGGAAE